ncbi:hypothetical protein PoB_005353100 [Plakobranchus ocellatus]|uniref:Uncharacterized protein n=1 Tax=Plakobranchus ocellatus TaxID=259542 RepID=A0AAV4BV05_9GAST|nr:hypothetical protein PoB_005353100 [Plakobranchus ocellatus]
MREQPIGAPSGPTDFAPGPRSFVDCRYVYQEKDPVRLSRKSLPRRRAGLRAEIEPAREETSQTGSAHRPTGPTGGALGQRPCRRARPSGAPGGARVYPGEGRSDGRGLAGPRAELESTREEAVQAGETYRGPGRS